ncbi:HAD hydrolase-like protein [Aliiroseovarius sp. KMU-50]|uniref:phosphoglycolate phosphatase n=1 Tax=Aliiroseovarius salicola TaxID=3009082 RepID=A0ABT4W758_9RHOB|nr:HAD hydrolase-like protein [Aliiroseovarius sp. KMU-50]MDA5095867.1 HAD hydrolase-like protein [Aliiroseovarius sp. KMU-50]
MLLFDFDGVIADSLGIYTSICTRTARQLGHPVQLPKNPFATLSHVSFECLAQSLGLGPVEYTAMSSYLLSKSTATAPAFNDMIELLHKVSCRVEVGILSASPRAFIDRFLDQHGGSDAVTLILSRDDPGTKADKMKTLQKNGRHLLALVGDGVSDISAAREANVPSIGVSWGWQSVSRLLQAGVDDIAQCPQDIERWVKKRLLSRAPEAEIQGGIR